MSQLRSALHSSCVMKGHETPNTTKKHNVIHNEPGSPGQRVRGQPLRTQSGEGVWPLSPWTAERTMIPPPVPSGMFWNVPLPSSWTYEGWS